LTNGSSSSAEARYPSTWFSERSTLMAAGVRPRASPARKRSAAWSRKAVGRVGVGGLGLRGDLQQVGVGAGVLVRRQLGQLQVDRHPQVVDLGQEQAAGHPPRGGEARRVDRLGRPGDGLDGGQVLGLGRLGDLVHLVVEAVIADEGGVDGGGDHLRLPEVVGDLAQVGVAHARRSTGPTPRMRQIRTSCGGSAANGVAGAPT
jgi:hypothetical protein